MTDSDLLVVHSGVGFQILVREEDALAARNVLDLPATPAP